MATGIEDLTARAKQLISERAYAEAIRACRRVLLSRPHEVPVRLLLGKALLAMRRYDEARAEMLAVLRSDPSEATAHRLLGEAYLRTGQPVKAREALVHAIEADPNDADSRDLLHEVELDAPAASQTIDRWFDPQAGATVQTGAPAFEEAHTGQVRLPPEPETGSSSVSVDPDFAAEARRAMGLDDEVSTDEDWSQGPLPPAPGRQPVARAPSSARPPPPPSVRPPPPVPPRHPGPGAPFLPGSDPTPSDSASTDPLTAAHTPSAKRGPTLPEGSTDELGLTDIDEVSPSLAGTDELLSDSASGEAATRALMRGEPDAMEQQLTAVRWNPDEFDEWDASTARGTCQPGGVPVFPDDPLPSGQRAPGPADPHRPGGLPAGMIDPFGDSEAGPVRSGLPTIPALADQGLHGSGATTGALHALRQRLPIPLVPALIGGGVISLVLIVTVTWAISAWLESSAEEEIAAAAEQAGDDGLKSSLDHAIELAEAHDDDDPEDLALRSRLLATATLEHGEDHVEKIQGLLGQLDSDEQNLPDARVANAYIRLARGDVEGARTALGMSVDENTELFRARALTAAAAADVARALPEARAAVSQRPSSPRHVALFALLTAEHGDAQAALTALDRVPGAEESPDVRIARARVLLESGGDPQAAQEQATAVLGALSDRATPPQKAWAHLVRARQAVQAGESTTALTEADAALAIAPAGSEEFLLLLAETYLQERAGDRAARVIERLPEQSFQRGRRAALVAEAAIETSDLDRAEASLREAAPGAHTDYLKGRLAEARGRLSEARELYERAASAREEFVRARARLGAIELATGNPARAVEMLQPAHELGPFDLEVVPLIARAYVASGQMDRALEAVRVALRQRRGAPELIVAKAQIDLARGNANEALEALRGVVRTRRDDPEIHTALGEAARQVGHVAEARRAFDRAIELRPGHMPALIGLADLALDGRELEAAERAITRAREAGSEGGIALDRVQARLHALRGAGNEAVEAVQGLARSSEDTVLWTCLGQVLAQAERNQEAERAFQRALRLDGQQPDALLGLATVQIRLGALGRVPSTIGAAERAGQSRGMGAAFEARLLAVRGALRFEYGSFDDAAALARQALEKDESSPPAHLLLAVIAIERGEDPREELRRAVAGQAPAAEAIGRLAVTLGRGDEACELAGRYMRMAPRGVDAPDVSAVVARCPR